MTEARGPASGPADPALDAALLPESQADVEAALAASEPPPDHHLFAFYDRLRERVLHGVEEKAGWMSEAAVEALLLVPDVFILLVRLAADPAVPGQARALIAGALAYFVLPVDILPEAILGAGGFLEDLVLAAAVLSHAFGGELEPFARRHWSGSHELRHVLHRLTHGAQDVLGPKARGRLEKLLGRRGLSLPDAGRRRDALTDTPADEPAGEPND